MAYALYKADGTLVTVPDNMVSNQFYSPNVNGVGRGVGVRLLGRNVLDYGTVIAQNFVQLTSNFAGPTVPPDATALQGQLWFNTGDRTLYVRSNSATSGGMTNWSPVGSGAGAIGQPIHNSSGDLLGYSAASVPDVDKLNDYEPLNTFNNAGFLGWAKKTPGSGMTAPLTDALGATIGYIFPA